jgi:hypothetical protein
MATNRLPKIIEKTLSRTKCPRTHHEELDPRAAEIGGSAPAIFVRSGYRAQICAGEAHTNAHIDHCMLCAPMWGVMAVKVGA